MCLHIDSEYHPKYGFGHPFVADRPLVVWKRLMDVTSTDGYSPYQGTRWVFGKERSARFTFADRRRLVEAGLHAFFSENAPRVFNNKLYPCVIPIGAQFFIGEGGEVVANRMIVYFTEAKMLSAFRVKKMGNPVKRSYYREQQEKAQ